MCVFSAASPPKKHTLVLFEAASGGLKKNILFRTRYLGKSTALLKENWHLGVIEPLIQSNYATQKYVLLRS